MKRVAYLLVVLNLALLGYFATKPADRLVSDGGGAGRLPRVAELALLPANDRAGQALDREMEVEDGRQGDEEVLAVSSFEASPVPSIEERYCFRVSGFDTRQDAESAISGLPQSVVDLGVEIVENLQELPPFHWVIIPPRSTREEALELFREVRQRGVDAYLVTEGVQENAISLGLFESREAAEQVMRQRNSQNINAVLALFPRNQIRYALVFEAAYLPGSQEMVAELADLNRRFDSVEINGCESIATPEKNP
ncbi:SPOR domain-containing protein [Marinobacter zhejiangensis]|uniref:Sporulation related domain-containing protein n=1 Tax=Marinobacter zhejiangensis TaxID=488535 RepID=A0A1I4TT29_9GAMM|nr:SPOR domain-containing protein [Marinobacter zhejiangensis]SFM79878.1 hypothetical protein SAMN04487963_0006 [Marinobacter zhejiangensis]